MTKPFPLVPSSDTFIQVLKNMSAALNSSPSFEPLMDNARSVLFTSAIVKVKGETAPIEGILEGLSRTDGIELRVGEKTQRIRWGMIESILPGTPSDAAQADKP